MKKIVILFLLLSSGWGFNAIAQTDPNERARIKEEIKRELKRELLEDMRKEAEAERQKKEDLARMKEEVRQELLKELKENAREDQNLRSELKQELIKELKDDARTQEQLRSEIKEELMREYKQENRAVEDIRREIKEELRKEMLSQRDRDNRREERQEERENLRRRRDESRNERLRDERDNIDDDRNNEDNERNRNDNRRNFRNNNRSNRNNRSDNNRRNNLRQERNQEQQNMTRRERRELHREERKDQQAQLRDLKLKLERGRQSGVNFGLMAGVNFSNFEKNKETNISNDQIAGFVGGGFFRFHSKWFYFQPEVLYSGKGADFGLKTAESEKVNERLRLNSLDVPLMVGVKLLEGRKLNFRIHAGPMVSLLLNSSGSSEQANKENFKTITAGYQVGAGFDVGNLTFDLRYEGSFTDLTTNEGRRNLSVNNLHNNIFRASLGFKIF